jgi:hypothetical protein
MRVLAMSALVCALVPGLSAMAEAQSSLKKLRRCLEFKDMTMPRLICYDAILPPTIDAAVYDAVMALPPDERRDRAKVNAAVRDGLRLGPLRPAGSADLYGVPKAKA